MDSKVDSQDVDVGMAKVVSSSIHSPEQFAYPESWPVHPDTNVTALQSTDAMFAAIRGRLSGGLNDIFEIQLFLDVKG